MDTKKLRKDILNQLDPWDEQNFFILGDMKGLTRSDIDLFLMCCDWFDENGSLEGLGYFRPKDRQILMKYGAAIPEREQYI